VTYDHPTDAVHSIGGSALEGSISLKDHALAVVAAVKAHNDAEAARLLVDLIERAPHAHDPDLLVWLRTAFGHGLAEKLTNILAAHPCFYCKHGSNVCAECAARGQLPSDLVCEACLSLGVDLCDFCNGSGLVTIRFVPAGLQPEVLRRRISLAEAMASTLLRRPVRRGEDGHFSEARKADVRLLLDLNRALGALEGVVEELPNSAVDSAEAAALCERTRGPAQRLAAHLQEALATLSRIARQRAGLAEQSALAAAFNRRADFYDALAGSRGSGTKLAHEALWRELSRGTHEAA
jgi:hypothetical protein